MTSDNVIEAVETALNPDTFDVMAYVAGQEVSTEEISIYVNVKSARRLEALVEKRAEEIYNRRELEKIGAISSLSIADADEDTEYDDEINELLAELENSALIFEIQTVAPALVRAITKKYVATYPKNGSEQEQLEHDEKMNADILRRAIKSVRPASSAVADTSEWSIEKLLEFEPTLYPEQGAKLITALHSIIYTGQVFEEALTADFS